MLFVALSIGTGKVKCWGNNHRNNTLVVHARKDIDCLPCDIWQYMGERETTKKKLKENRSGILDMVNKQYGKSFTCCIID